MNILRNNSENNLILNNESNFKIDLGWSENFKDFENETLEKVINPIENYETVRYIHKPYSGITNNPNDLQSDIWFYFYFLSGGTYVQDYQATGLSLLENAKMLKQSTESFFRLEFFKTTNNEPPERMNRRLVFAKNLTLPLGEQFYMTKNDFYEKIFVPVFTGSNYRNTENMYFFWFNDDTSFNETSLTGTTFWMTAKYFNAKDGTILDFVNNCMGPDDEVVENRDVYYKLEIDRTDFSYQIYNYTGTTGNRVGVKTNPVIFYEKGGGICVPTTIFPTPTLTPTPAPTSTPIPTATPVSTSTPTPEPTPVPTSTPIPTATPVSTSTPEPTPAPTSTPTTEPTPVPTSTPTPEPTPVPTSTPIPTATPVPTSTPTPEPTPVPTSTPTPTATSIGLAIQLSTPQNNECVACNLTTYSQTRYVNINDITPNVGDIVYQDSTLTTGFTGGNSLWFKTTWGSPTEYSIQIDNNGQVLNVKNCSTCPTPTPTSTIIPTSTPTPTSTLTPEPTPTSTSTPTPTATIVIDCYEYTALADQVDLDNSDNGTVYFEYIDCDGLLQTEQRGTNTPGNPVCARSVGSVYILVGGNASTTSNSSWSAQGNICNSGGEL